MDGEPAAQRPRDIDEAISCIRATLEEFHNRHDKRAIFLRLLYIMTLEVDAAITGFSGNVGRKTFMNPEWVSRLLGQLAGLYFRSLGADEQTSDQSAWDVAHRTARSKGSKVAHNALLGMNAHINYDLARAIGENLEPGDLKNYLTLQRRKLDHDQVSNLLLRTLGPVQDVLARDYSPGIALADTLLGGFDDLLWRVGLRHYSERVWWDALTYAAAAAEGREQIVQDKLSRESYMTAELITELINRQRVASTAERMLGLPWSMLGTARWDRIQFESRISDGPERGFPELRIDQ